MKKIVFILVALMFAAPALADVDITMAQVGDTNEVIISITSTETNLVRAYALDIKLAPYLDSINPVVLEVTALNPGYWVFPGTIQIDPDGNITNLGSPVAEYDDLQSDTLGGLDSNGVTVELASLYAPPIPTDPNAPVQNGALLSVKVSDDACITITANVSRAGASGVVMEDPDDDPTVNLPAELCIEVVPPVTDCYAGQPDYDEWVLVGEPNCWCNTRQCHGDADGNIHGSPLFGEYYVGAPDLSIFLSAWKILEPPKGPGIASVTDGICADFDHLIHGSPLFGEYRVGAPDLSIFITNWKILEPPKGDGIPADCLDLP